MPSEVKRVEDTENSMENGIEVKGGMRKEKLFCLDNIVRRISGNTTDICRIGVCFQRKGISLVVCRRLRSEGFSSA